MAEEISDWDSVGGSHLSNRNLEVCQEKKSRKLSILSINSEKYSSNYQKSSKRSNKHQTGLKSVAEGIVLTIKHQKIKMKIDLQLNNWK